jgi:hypothetical protein
MADGGIGESALLDAALSGAAVGGGASLLTGQDPLQGALMGGLTGGLFGGINGAFADVPAGTDAFTASQAPVSDAFPTTPGVTPGTPVYGGSVTGTPMPAYGSGSAFNPYADLGAGTGASSGLPFQTGGSNVYENFSELGPASTTEPISASSIGPGSAGTSATISPDAVATGASATPAATTSPGGIGDLADKAGSFLDNNKYKLAGGLGLAYLMNQERNKYGVPATEKYSGPLSKFNYNPLTYQPVVINPPSPLYRAQYAAGGPVEQMTNNNAIGANTGFPQAYMHTSAFSSPYQTPISQNVLTGAGDVGVDPYTGEQQSNGGMNQPMGQVNFASGGISSLGSYSDGGRMLKGPGDGMSDDIPAKIGGKQEARLADGEFVVSADVVSGLGNGSTDAGAKQLYKMMDKVRSARTGTKKQGKQIKPERYLPA